MTARKAKPRKRAPKKTRAPRSPVARREHTGEASRPGRPAIQWTEEAGRDVQRLARAGNTVADMAAILEVSKRSLEAAIANEELPIREAYYRGLAERRDAIRAAQLRHALRGNAQLLIWLGKQDLGQRDVKRVELLGEDGGPVAVQGELGPVVRRKLEEFLRSRRKER